MNSRARFLPDWIHVSLAWSEAATRLVHVCQKDCEASTVSQETFSAQLLKVHSASMTMAAARSGDRLIDGAISVTSDYKVEVDGLVSLIQTDCQSSSTSQEAFGSLLTDLAAAASNGQPDEDLSSVKDFLASGLKLDHAMATRQLSERAAHAVLAQAVAGPLARLLTFSPDGIDGDVELCRTPFGVYEIQELFGGCVASFKFGNTHRRLLQKVGSTREQAIASCQSDFNNRVRECLVNPGWEPLTPVRLRDAKSTSTSSPVRRARP